MGWDQYGVHQSTVSRIRFLLTHEVFGYQDKSKIGSGVSERSWQRCDSWTRGQKSNMDSSFSPEQSRFQLYVPLYLEGNDWHGPRGAVTFFPPLFAGSDTAIMVDRCFLLDDCVVWPAVLVRRPRGGRCYRKKHPNILFM